MIMIKQTIIQGQTCPVCPHCGEPDLRLQAKDEVACGTCARVFVVENPEIVGEWTRTAAKRELTK